MDKLDVYTKYALSEPTHVGILYLMLFLYIIFITNGSPKEFNSIFINVIIQFILIFIGIMFTMFNKGLGIIYMIAYTVTFVYVYYTYLNNRLLSENFTVVEDNLDNVIQVERNSLLAKLENKSEDVIGPWGCSAWGKENGLCKI